MYLQPPAVHQHCLTEITELAAIFVNGGDMMNITTQIGDTVSG